MCHRRLFWRLFNRLSFHLVKNGTVTEKCLPYSSADVTSIFEEVEQCPTKCKDGSDIIKYHSKNAYSTLYDYNQDNYCNKLNYKLFFKEKI